MIGDKTGSKTGSKAGTGHLHEQAPPGPTVPATPSIRLENVAKHFGAVAAVNGVSLALAKGQLLALLGPSGCGKTTLLRLIAGFEALDGGEHRDRRRARRRERPPSAARTPPHRHGLPGVRALPSPERGPEHRLRPPPLRRRHQQTRGGGGRHGGPRRPRTPPAPRTQRRPAAACRPRPRPGPRTRPGAARRALLQPRRRLARARPRRGAQHPARRRRHRYLCDPRPGRSAQPRRPGRRDARGRVHQIGQPQQIYHQPATRSVAEFIGDANFFPGEANGQVVTCELGDLFLQYAAQGAVDVLVRPENVTVKPAPPATPSRVRSVLFFGHDQLVSIQLSSGRVLDARVSPIYNFAIGQPVAVQVNGLVMAYPRNGA